MPIGADALERLGHTELAALPSGTLLGCSKDILLAREDALLWFLGDVFTIPPPFPLPTAFSSGDVFIACGVFILVQAALLGKYPSTPGPAVPTRSTQEEETV